MAPVAGAGETDGPAGCSIEEGQGPIGGRSSAHWILLGCAAASIITMVALAVFVEPDERGFGTHEQLGMLPCRSMDWLGIPCPGFGVTTSVALAVRGRPLAALTNQPFGLLTALCLPLLCVWALRIHFGGGDLYAALSSRRARPALALAVAALVAAWIYKIWLVTST